MRYILLLFFLSLAFFNFSFASLPESDRVDTNKNDLSISAHEVFGRVNRVMSQIRDVQAEMICQIFIKRLGFPFSITADYYFKTPDKVKIKLRGIPGLLMGDVPKTISAATTLTGFPKDYESLYKMRLTGIRKTANRDCYYLELTPVQEGSVAKTILWIDEHDYTIPKLVTNYRDGSWIEVSRQYAKIHNRLLVQHVEAQMDFVKNDLKATVSANYEKYRINQGISEAIFNDNKN